jgi:tagatose 1,6-diphosphate aldolase
LISENKQNRMRALCTPRGVIAAIAVDQRKSLRWLMAQQAGTDTARISDSQLAEFKRAVARCLTPEASAILIDPEFGTSAFDRRAPGCGLLMTYESDGFENPRPHRMPALMPGLSARRLREMGADGVKVLLSYTPLDDAAANDEKCAMVERIGYECEAAGLAFFLEPVSYDLDGLDTKSYEFAHRRAGIVVRMMDEFSKDIYKVDVLKVEFPVNASFVEGSPVYTGPRAWSHAEALEIFREADSAARRPYIYLSAGAATPHFIASLHLASEAGARFSGVLCGRATWQDGVLAYVRRGLPGLEPWLNTEGMKNLRAVNDCLAAATPWQDR